MGTRTVLQLVCDRCDKTIGPADADSAERGVALGVDGVEVDGVQFDDLCPRCVNSVRNLLARLVLNKPDGEVLLADKPGDEIDPDTGETAAAVAS